MKVRILRGYYNDREKSVKTGEIREMRDARAAVLIKRGLAVAIEATAAAAKATGGRGKGAAGKAEGKSRGVPSGNRRQAGSQTGKAKSPSSSRQGQARRAPESGNTGETGTGEGGDNSAS